MSPDETMGLLELLYQNRESIHGAAGGEAYTRHRQEVQTSLSQDFITLRRSLVIGVSTGDREVIFSVLKLFSAYIHIHYSQLCW